MAAFYEIPIFKDKPISLDKVIADLVELLTVIYVATEENLFSCMLLFVVWNHLSPSHGRVSNRKIKAVVSLDLREQEAAARGGHFDGSAAQLA